MQNGLRHGSFVEVDVDALKLQIGSGSIRNSTWCIPASGSFVEVEVDALKLQMLRSIKIASDA